MNGAVAILILMFKEEILKRATSKQAKKMNFRNDKLIPKSELKQKVDGQVEESVAQVPVAGKNTGVPK